MKSSRSLIASFLATFGFLIWQFGNLMSETKIESWATRKYDIDESDFKIKNRSVCVTTRRDVKITGLKTMTKVAVLVVGKYTGIKGQHRCVSISF